MDAHTHIDASGAPPRRVAFSATVHCVTGCAIGEVLGMVVATAAGWGNGATIAVSVALAFVFGYTLTLLPVVRSGMALAAALPIAFAADTLSIAVMEVVDSVIMLVIPGAIDAQLDTILFWGSLLSSLVVAFLVAWPVNYHLIRRGRGHAVVHQHHH
jgi:hypothetical protein